MQHKFRCVDLFGRSWRTWKTNWTIRTYLGPYKRFTSQMHLTHSKEAEEGRMNGRNTLCMLSKFAVPQYSAVTGSSLWIQIAATAAWHPCEITLPKGHFIVSTKSFLNTMYCTTGSGFGRVSSVVPEGAPSMEELWAGAGGTMLLVPVELELRDRNNELLWSQNVRDNEEITRGFAKPVKKSWPGDEWHSRVVACRQFMDVNSDGAEEIAATYQSRCVWQFTIKLRLVTRNLSRRVDQFDAMQGTQMRLEQTLKPTVLNP